MFNILDDDVGCKLLVIIVFDPYVDTVNGMFVNVAEVRELEVLEAIDGSTWPPHVIREGADIAIDLSSSKSANSSR